MFVPNFAGALTGKYTPENPPTGPRGRIYTPEFLTKVWASDCKATIYWISADYHFLLIHATEFCAMQLQPLINRINEIGENYGKTPTQVLFVLTSLCF